LIGILLFKNFKGGNYTKYIFKFENKDLTKIVIMMHFDDADHVDHAEHALLSDIRSNIQFHQEMIMILTKQRYDMMSMGSLVVPDPSFYDPNVDCLGRPCKRKDNESIFSRKKCLREKLKKHKKGKLERRNKNKKKEKYTNYNLLRPSHSSSSKPSKLSKAISSTFNNSDLNKHQHDARSGLQDNEREIDKIRARETELIKSGVSPLEAKNQTQKELYPKSINTGTKKGHMLLAIQDSSDDDNKDVEKAAHDLFHTPAVLQKLEDMGIIESHENYDDDDILDEVVIYSA